MADLKTKPTDKSVVDFLQTIENENRRNDSFELLRIFERATNMTPKMWGESIIGYGQYHYEYERSRQVGDWPLVAFSPRKASLTIYAMPQVKNYEALLKRLGKHKTSVACIYISKLSDVDIEVLSEIISASVAEMKRLYPDAKTT